MLYAFDGRRPRIGEGTYVSEHALVIGDVVIGENCYIGHGAILRGDYGTITIGAGTAVEEGVIVHVPPADLSDIGERVTIGHGAIIHSTLIGDRAVIGMGAVLSIRARVGENSIVAEGAVVKWNQVIPPDVVAGGNPARVIRPVANKDTELWAGAKQLYIDLAKKYLALGMELIPHGPDKEKGR
jgi:carbonic anhydrase/acetyltransferase-like protein (isoleucine patch superfamily)